MGVNKDRRGYLLPGCYTMNRTEKEKFQVAFMNLESLLQKDKNAVIPAEEIMDWLENFTGWKHYETSL